MIEQFLNKSLSPNTVLLYQRAISEFSRFRLNSGLPVSWPPNVMVILSFIMYLIQKNLAHSSINCYLSGISFYCKINDFDDPTQKFVVRKVLEGLKRSKGTVHDHRLPITSDLLYNILRILPNVCKNAFETLLFRTSFSVAFHAMLRISEFALSSTKSQHALVYSDVSLHQNAVLIQIGSSKTDQYRKGVCLKLDHKPGFEYCPVLLVSQFFKVRPPNSGLFFCHFDTKPLTRFQVVTVLKKALELLGVDKQFYSSHSFRIGAATSMAIQGFNDVDIMKAGRWKSSCFKRYIRP